MKLSDNTIKILEQVFRLLTFFALWMVLLIAFFRIEIAVEEIRHAWDTGANWVNVLVRHSIELTILTLFLPSLGRFLQAQFEKLK